jgi:mono/diheme cytochrome c family protein
MRKTHLVCTASVLVFIAACAANDSADPLEGLVERPPIQTAPAPDADARRSDVSDPAVIEQGRYMVQLLGCGSCHTQGSLFGVPETAMSLAGSDIGIAHSTPLQNRYPAVTFPPNLTPDNETGLGRWSIEKIAQAISYGSTQHGARLNTVMPWRGFSSISEDDVIAIASYLKSIPPVRHRIPADVGDGEFTSEAHVYFGIYERE